ncbi:hypothetical protein [Actinosynnema sp. NPDC023587]|uniref:hypothetical protein n=1 Tax=Actinosynnema sp. NPDC023587 TaxID=3154695 RepID=UPI00340966D5
MTDPDSRPQPAEAPRAPAADTAGTASDTVPDAVPDASPDAGPADEPSPEAAGDPPRPAPPVDPQSLFGSLSLASIEADIDAMMNDKMTELDGMLAGLEQLVVRLEGEITSLETPPDDSPTP